MPIAAAYNRPAHIMQNKYETDNVNKNTKQRNSKGLIRITTYKTSYSPKIIIINHKKRTHTMSLDEMAQLTKGLGLTLLLTLEI